MKKILGVFLSVIMVFHLFGGILVADASEPLPSYVASEAWKDPDSAEWSYYVRNVTNGTMTEMERNESTGMYLGGSANYVNDTWQSTGTNGAIWSVREFTAPYTGTIQITMQDNVVGMTGWSGQTGDPVRTYAKIVRNYEDEKWYGDFTRGVNNPGRYGIEVGFDTLTMEVQEGDTVAFMTGTDCGTSTYVWFAPTITYISISKEEENPGENPGEEIKPIEIFDSETEFSGDGSGVWSYYERDVYEDVYTALTYNSEKETFGNENTGAWISKNAQSTTNNASLWTVRAFEAPYSGTVTISFKDDQAVTDAEMSDTVFAKVWHSGKEETELLSKYLDHDRNSLEAVRRVQVKKGDKLYFMVGSAYGANKQVEWSPVVSYTALENGEDVTDSNDKGLIPPTGDDSLAHLPMLMFALTVSLAGVIFLACLRKKENKKRRA